jgi:hypothetical protein
MYKKDKMSGQPYIFPIDQDKFRKEYLANLNLRALIDDKNLQANKVYKNTGVPTQPTDTRTSAEKLADVERLKVEIRSKLRELTTGDQIDVIINDLNNNADLIRFLSQNIDTIIKDLKPKFSKGISAVEFKAYFDRYKQKFDATQGVEFGLQQETGNQILTSLQSIQANTINRGDIQRIDTKLNSLGRGNQRIFTEMRDNLQLISTALGLIPDAQKVINESNNPILIGQIQTLLNATFSSLPTRAQVEGLLRTIQQGQDLNSPEIIQDGLARLNAILAQYPDTQENIEVLQQLLRTGVNRSVGTEEAGPPRPTYIPLTELPQYRGAELAKYLDDIDTYTGGRFLRQAGRTTPYKAPSTLKQSIPDMIKFLTDKDEFVRDNILPVAEGTAVGITTAGKAGNLFLTPSKPIGTAQAKAESGDKLGRGIYKKKRYDTINKMTDIDYSKGIKQSPKWVPFGRFVINTGKLNDDIISVKRPAGSGISGFKAMRVNRRLSNVIRKIVGNGNPSFEELNALESDERDYLYKLARSSDLLDKLNIPTPTKDEEEKDIHQFEIMKGQIMSGNNSTDLIKKFKTLLMKLMKKGLIPKSQAKDILLDLTEEGY